MDEAVLVVAAVGTLAGVVNAATGVALLRIARMGRKEN
jgi:hypothetical protein